MSSLSAPFPQSLDGNGLWDAMREAESEDAESALAELSESFAARFIAGSESAVFIASLLIICALTCTAAFVRFVALKNADSREGVGFQLAAHSWQAYPFVCVLLHTSILAAGLLTELHDVRVDATNAAAGRFAAVVELWVPLSLAVTAFATEWAHDPRNPAATADGDESWRDSAVGGAKGALTRAASCRAYMRIFLYIFGAMSCVYCTRWQGGARVFDAAPGPAGPDGARMVFGGVMVLETVARPAYSTEVYWALMSIAGHGAATVSPKPLLSGIAHSWLASVALSQLSYPLFWQATTLRFHGVVVVIIAMSLFCDFSSRWLSVRTLHLGTATAELSCVLALGYSSPGTPPAKGVAFYVLALCTAACTLWDAVARPRPTGRGAGERYMYVLYWNGRRTLPAILLLGAVLMHPTPAPQLQFAFIDSVSGLRPSLGTASATFSAVFLIFFSRLGEDPCARRVRAEPDFMRAAERGFTCCPCCAGGAAKGYAAVSSAAEAGDDGASVPDSESPLD